MIDAELLQMLRCPETRQTLTPATAAVLDGVNQRIAAGGLQNRAGRAVPEKLEAGLLREDGKFLYPVRQGIPVMLMDESIPLA